MGRDDTARFNRLRTGARLERTAAGIAGDAAGGSFSEAAARWKQRRIQHGQGRIGTELTGGAKRRSRSSDRNGTRILKVNNETPHLA